MAAVTGSVSNVQSVAQFDDAIARDSTLSVTYFYADFHDACRPNGQLDVVLRQLATLYPRVRFLKVAAEELPDLSDRFLVTVVPTFVIAQGPVVLEKLEGTNVAVLAKRVDVLNSSVVHTTTTSTSAANETPSKPLDDARQDRLAKLLYAAPVMLFLKGTPSEPKCDASRDIVALLDEEEIAFSTFDVLQDQDVQEGLKLMAKSSTFPQLYVSSSFIGGLEELKEIKSKGSIADHIGVTKKLELSDAAFQASLRALVNSAPVLLFMKGTPSDPKCGFSKKTVQLLRDHEIAFSYFDILSDARVRQGLKQFANWPTYPQLYVKGKLVGGLDILNEMAEDGDLSEQLGVEKKKNKKENKYEQLINRARVMIFIKGTPQQPQCGFSRKLVDILDSEGFKYDSFDILTDDSVRQGLKKYSNWPTFPQLYVKGELVGGLDIVQQMQEDGELVELKE